MEDNIKVVLRSRPLNKREQAAKCTSMVRVSEAEHSILLDCKPEAKQFTFDHVVGEESTQESVFRAVGVPLTESCLEGFNGTIIAYGQTGSGKTHTLFGAAGTVATADDERGLVPRVFEYLWQKMAVAESGAADNEAPEYSCKCSFYEIYNERVYDLLHSVNKEKDSNSNSGSSLNIREDQSKGVYVDGLTEEAVNSPDAAKRVLNLGYRSRHVSATAMNRDSSRSHAVFLLTVTVTALSEGVRVTNSATFSLVDLAGSERQKSTQAEGMRLKEASKINQSLSTLGSVIHSLSIGSGGKFVRYRDSALTFLLRDSLGGNSKTVLIANVSPSSDALNETLGTLKFASRAKTVRNTVSANIFTSGTVETLQKEIRTLRDQLADYQSQSRMDMTVLASGHPLDWRSLNCNSSRSSPSRSSSGSSSGSSRGSRSGSSGGEDAAPAHTPAGVVLASLQEPSLLSAALRRFQRLDGARVRAELRVHSLGKQVQALTDSSSGSENNNNNSNSGSSGVDSAENLRLRGQVEQLQQQLAELHEQPEPWAEAEEAPFTADVIGRLEDAERRVVLLDQQWGDLSSSTFEAGAGMTPYEARSLQQRCDALAERAETSERSCSQMKMNLLEVQQALAVAQPGQEQASVRAAAAQLSAVEWKNRASMLQQELEAQALLRPKVVSAAEMAASAAELQQAAARVLQLEQELCASQGLQLQLQRDLQKHLFERDQASERAESAESAAANSAEEVTSSRRQLSVLHAQLEAVEEHDARSHVDSVELQSQLQYEQERRAELQEQLCTVQEERCVSRDVVQQLQEQLGALSSQAQSSAAEAQELASLKQELLSSLSDREHEQAAVQAALDTAKKQLAILSGAHLVQTQKAAADLPGAPDTAAQKQVADGYATAAVQGTTSSDEDSRQKDAMIQQLRSDLLVALQKADQSSQVRSNLLTCQGELQALQALYAASKTHAVEAEARASAMMAQLLDVSKVLHLQPGANVNAPASAPRDRDTAGKDASKDEARDKQLREYKEQVGRERRRAKKLVAERDASREVLAEVEAEAETLRGRLNGGEGALQEVRMENTKLREGIKEFRAAADHVKAAENKEVAALHSTVRQRDAKIERLRQEREAARTEAHAEKEGRAEAERLAMANMSASLRKSSSSSAADCAPALPLPMGGAKMASHEHDAPELVLDDDGMPPPPSSVSTRRRGLSSRGSVNVSSRGSRRGGADLPDPLEL